MGAFLLLVVFFLVSFFIVGLVLLQEGKGGGLVGMSSGMDGVMGAKNPLRRMTAWLFVVFVFLAIGINWYFHQRQDTALPTGADLPASTVRTLEETSLSAGPVVLGEPEGETAAETATTTEPAPGEGEATLPAPAETDSGAAPEIVPEAVPEASEPEGAAAEPAPAESEAPAPAAEAQ